MPDVRTRLGLAVLAAVTTLALVCGASARAGHERAFLERPLLLAAPGAAVPESRLGAAGKRRLRAATWWGGTYTAATGEPVRIFVSPSYPADDAAGQAWADFFAGLLHGSELSLVTVYVAPPAEVAEECGHPQALGCYGGRTILTIGDSSAGVAPALVATHEYGHHIADNRLNPPWRSVDWGTKRWASSVGICARAAAGTVFPGDEDGHYELNPGEGFAEAYRVTNEARAGATGFSWPIVANSFFPDTAARAAVEEDVLRPWTVPATSTLTGRFAGRGARAWTRTLDTPLDGDLGVLLRVPAGALYELELRSPEGSVLARGLWSGSRQKTARYTVCGQRSLSLRVVPRGTAGRFSLTVSHP